MSNAIAIQNQNTNITKEKKERMNIDGFIEKLLNLKFLSESELKDICEKVNLL